MPIAKMVSRFAALTLQDENDRTIFIEKGQVRLPSGLTGIVASITVIDETNLPAKTFSRAKGAGAGAAIGLLFSPLGAAIGAAAGAALSKGERILRIEIQVEGWMPIRAQIPASKARALEIVAQRPIL